MEEGAFCWSLASICMCTYFTCTHMNTYTHTCIHIHNHRSIPLDCSRDHILWMEKLEQGLWRVAGCLCSCSRGISSWLIFVLWPLAAQASFQWSHSALSSSWFTVRSVLVRSRNVDLMPSLLVPGSWLGALVRVSQWLLFYDCGAYRGSSSNRTH